MHRFFWFIVLISITSQARADSDTLLPVTFASLQGDLKKALSKVTVREQLSALPCLEGSSEKRTVCPYKLGDYMQIMAETEKGGKDIIGVTLICGTQDTRDSLKCLMAWGAAMAVLAPDLDQDKRAKVINALMEGVLLGTEASIRTDDRKFILQKSVGLWFHIYAADADN
jgi:hypothetical protein